MGISSFKTLLLSCLAMASIQELSAQQSPSNKETYQDFNMLLVVGARAGYSIGNLFGGATVPTFQGPMYSGSAEYIIGRRRFSVAPFFEYRWMKLQNSANTLTETDTWKQSFMGGGLRVYSYGAFLKIGYGKSDVTETIVEGVTVVRSATPSSILTGGGMSWVAARNLRIELGLDLMHTKIATADGTFPNRHDLFNYAAHLGFKFVIDSGYSKVKKE